MVSMPDRNWSDPWIAFGVVGREGMGVTDRDTTPFSLLSLDSDMFIEHNASKIYLYTDFWSPASKTLQVRSEETSMFVINNDQLCTASLRHRGSTALEQLI